MSALCGLYRFNQQVVCQSELDCMTQSMAVLGPDGSGVWHSDRVGLGFRAHHLTLESLNEVLPFYDAESRVAITADCRLDNRDVLCDYFGLKDEPCWSDSDLILRAWLRWGRACPQYLLGEFAVVIWDESAQELVCFTDHTGQRTFYYYHDADLFAIASDIHALHTVEGISREPNLVRIAAHGNVSYLLNRPEMTAYQSILKVPARTMMVIKNKHIERHVYWQPDIEKRLYFKTEDDYVEAFQDLFSTIVRAKLRSHCPVVTLHSGGLDSSSITAMAANLLHAEGKSLTALSAVLPAGYQGEAYDESDYIYLLKKPNLHIQPVTDEWRGPFDGLDHAHYYKNPIDKSSRYFLCEALATAATNNGARIILDGCFGEKGPSFHGNGYFAELLINQRWRTLLRESRLHTARYDRSWIKFILREGLMPLLPGALQAKLSLRSDIAFSKQLFFVKSDFIDAQLGDVGAQKERLRLNTQYPNHRRHQHESMLYLQAHNGVVHDDQGAPVQFSYPYNDKRMLEFCLALPGDLKVREGYKRYSIRGGMRGLMPDELRFRTTKEPFSPDYHHRFNRQLDKARHFVAQAVKTPLINSILDIPKLEQALAFTMQTNRCNTKQDFSSMHTIPMAVYLMAFLGTF